MEAFDFLTPYLKAFGVTDDAAAKVMISSAEIYRRQPDAWLDEEAPVDTASPWYEAEQRFIAANKGKECVVLRCAPIVGTGMTGTVRRLAEDIWRGTFFHFPGNDAHISVVHAVDVARAVKALSDIEFDGADVQIFNLTDTVDPMLHDLAEALAYRMNNKRISTLSTKPQQWMGRIAYGRRKYEQYTRPQLYRSAKIRQYLDFEPTDVCAYLRTHVYDDNSL